MKENEDTIKEEDLDLPPKLADVKNVRSIIEDSDNHRQHKVGLTGLPLAYVVRSDVGLPANADDPGYGQPDPMTEMI